MNQTPIINIGFGNFVLAKRVVTIVNPLSSPMRRLREDAKGESRLIDATQGRKTRSLIITDSNHVILSSVLPETIIQRIESINENKLDMKTDSKIDIRED